MRLLLLYNIYIKIECVNSEKRQTLNGEPYLISISVKFCLHSQKLRERKKK